MNILLIGSGGREHALAWKIAQSPRLKKLYIAPGNAGTAQLGENISQPLDRTDNYRAISGFCQQQHIDLVVVGPEAPLSDGIVDILSAAGIPAFGPRRAAAQIEASKAFAKAFMARHRLPTARFAAFSDFQAASHHLQQINYPVVIKASGLAAGKGVLLPGTPAEAEAALRAALVNGEFGAAGETVIIEERLEGEEVSLLAFCDGVSIKTMPPAQDHKRLLDGDQGPNTGGMGAYAPAPACPPALVEQVRRTILEPTIAGLRAEGAPFVGVLYAGLMLTAQGPQVLEFNCRFGDPETQAILPLLDSDLLDILEACTQGRLESCEIRWKPGAAACVVAASAGYPGPAFKGLPIDGLEKPASQAVIFQAGTRASASAEKNTAGDILTDGGRVLGVTGWGADLKAALGNAYRALEKISFEGMQYRKDIGWRALAAQDSYAQAGVDIDAGNRAVKLMSQAVRSTYGPEVLAGIGAFGGLFDGVALKEMRSPVLVASTDGVGTKVMLAAQVGSYHAIGQDIVNHCTNDILVQGARPLFFLDYFASSKIQPEIVAQVVGGMAQACREAGCALLGGETAEMPGVYSSDRFDVVGTIVGCVEKERILPRPDLQAGDVLLGLRSSGPHTNGYSLIRKVFAGVSLDTVFPELGVPLQDALLAPHRSYLPVLWPALDQSPGPIKALAHLTGGGLVENLPRVLPAGLGAAIDIKNWPVPALFHLIQERGQIAPAEMFRIFNMGIGMVVICAPEHVAQVKEAIGETVYEIGQLVASPSQAVAL